MPDETKPSKPEKRRSPISARLATTAETVAEERPPTPEPDPEPEEKEARSPSKGLGRPNRGVKAVKAVQRKMPPRRRPNRGTRAVK